MIKRAKLTYLHINCRRNEREREEKEEKEREREREIAKHIIIHFVIEY
jgi:hypothetical protein